MRNLVIFMLLCRDCVGWAEMPGSPMNLLFLSLRLNRQGRGAFRRIASIRPKAN